MPRGDAVQNQPTVEDQMAQFKGFSTTDGEVSNGAPLPKENEVQNQKQQANQQAKAAESKNAQARDPKAAAAKSAGNDGAAEGEGAEGTAAGKEGEGKGKPAGGKVSPEVQKRINVAVRAQREAERREAAAVARAASVEARLAALEQSAAKPGKATDLTNNDSKGKVDPDAPNPADFEFGELDVNYVRAVARYEAKKEMADERKKASDAKLTEEQQRLKTQYEGQRDAMADAGAELYDDFHEVVIEGAELGTFPVSKDTAQALLEIEDSTLAAKIAYHLATNLDEAKKLAGLSPTAQLRKIGQLEVRFSSESPDADQQEDEEGAEGDKPAARTPQQPAKVKVTKAPPPPSSRARGSNATQNVSAATNDFAAFEKMAMGGGQ